MPIYSSLCVIWAARWMATRWPVSYRWSFVPIYRALFRCCAISVDSVLNRCRRPCEPCHCAVCQKQRKTITNERGEKNNVRCVSWMISFGATLEAWVDWNYTFITLIPLTEQLGLNTGSVTSFNTCGSSACVLITKRWPFGPFAWTLYCQKYRSFLLPELRVGVSSLSESANELQSQLRISRSRLGACSNYYRCQSNSLHSDRCRCLRSLRRARNHLLPDLKFRQCLEMMWNRLRPDCPSTEDVVAAHVVAKFDGLPIRPMNWSGPMMIDGNCRRSNAGGRIEDDDSGSSRGDFALLLSSTMAPALIVRIHCARATPTTAPA